MATEKYTNIRIKAKTARLINVTCQVLDLKVWEIVEQMMEKEIKHRGLTELKKAVEEGADSQK